MKLNKKGFTLVELLAVIVVLAIIALIGFGAVGPIIEDSRMNAAVSTVSNYAAKASEECMRLWVNSGAGTKLPTAEEVNTAATTNMTGDTPTNGDKVMTIGENCTITWKSTYEVSESKVVTVSNGLTVGNYDCGIDDTSKSWKCKKK